uniref:Uncharacterized protein n=1 Tax=Methylophaga nitratireducenticrescens TaxID=754476 RepID=I1XFG6_METNJ
MTRPSTRGESSARRSAVNDPDKVSFSVDSEIIGLLTLTGVAAKLE